MLMPEYMRELHNNGYRRYLATGHRHINWQGTELTALRKNGQEFPVEISFGELTRDGHKVFTGFIRDISERKQAEEKLRASERTLRELTETIPQMLWSAEADGAIDYCNQRVLDYTGLSVGQVRGSGWMKTVHQDDIEKMAQAWTGGSFNRGTVSVRVSLPASWRSVLSLVHFQRSTVTRPRWSHHKMVRERCGSA